MCWICTGDRDACEKRFRTVISLGGIVVVFGGADYRRFLQ